MGNQCQVPLKASEGANQQDLAKYKDRAENDGRVWRIWDLETEKIVHI